MRQQTESRGGEPLIGKDDREGAHRRIHLIEYQQDRFPLDSRKATEVVEMSS
jgi:hypothetical protein